jgi:hypothetical protein
MIPLGYKTAKKVVGLRRRAFFGGVNVDLPSGRSPVIRKDDLTPQFGYVGSRYRNTRVLILGINPGNGPSDIRTREDKIMMPLHRRFAADPSARNFEAATAAYKTACQRWHVWTHHCAAIIGAGKLSLEEIAYSNCLPWRTASKSEFSGSAARKAIELYVLPLINELRPKVVIALGKRASRILESFPAKLPHVITWNRAYAATAAVKKERAVSAASVFKALNR